MPPLTRIDACEIRDLFTSVSAPLRPGPSTHCKINICWTNENIFFLFRTLQSLPTSFQIQTKVLVMAFEVLCDPPLHPKLLSLPSPWLTQLCHGALWNLGHAGGQLPPWALTLSPLLLGSPFLQTCPQLSLSCSSGVCSKHRALEPSLTMWHKITLFPLRSSRAP